jgi:AcrR family transcriptional regulator
VDVPSRQNAEPRKDPRQRRSRQTVDWILDAAARIFDERGYRATTTNHVAAAAGVSIGSLYQYFPNKDALLAALAQRHVDEALGILAERAAALADQEPPVEEVVRQLVQVAADANASSGLHALLYTQAPRTPAVEARLSVLTDLATAAVAQHLARLRAGGSDPSRRARLLVAAVDSAIHAVVLDYPPGRQRQDAVDDLVDVLVHGLHGAGPHPTVSHSSSRA